MTAFTKALIISCLILASCTSRTGIKTDYRPYADTCESCYDTLSHMHIYIKNHAIPPQKTRLDSIKAYIKLHDSVRTSVKVQYVKTAKEALELAKKEENLTQMFLFEEHLYIANKYRTFADRQLCDSIRLHYAKEMVQTAMQIEDADTIGIAITHYMDAMKHVGGKIDMEPILQKVKNLKSFVHNPDKYAKILCVIARKYSAIGDYDNAKKYLSKALNLSIRGNAETTEVTGRRAAQQLLDKGEIKEAVQTYYSVLLMRDSVVKEKDEARATQQEADEVFLHNMGLWVVLVLVIVCGTWGFWHFHRKQRVGSRAYRSEISMLRETIAQYEQTLQKLEKSEIENRAEIADMKKEIERLRSTIVERLKTGKMVYDELHQGHPLSREIKGAESYLIDYYVIFMPEKYEKWSQEYEGLTPHMYTYLILMDMNYSDTDIQRILSISPSSLRSLRSRIMSRRIM